MTLRLRDRTFELDGTPLLMGIVNATPDSFSDAGDHPTLEARVEHGVALLQAGADLLDVGGESASGHLPAVDAQAEIERVVPLIVRLTSEHGAAVSVDTYKPAVAEAAIAAGAVLVNDVSGLRDPDLAAVCARTGAGLVLMHTRVEPKGTLLDPGHYDDVVADVAGFLRERMEIALEQGVAPEQILLDPGPDFAKTPAQTVDGAARARRAARARPPAPAGGLQQGLRRRDHRARVARAARGHARGGRARGRRRRVRAARARRGRRRPTSCACAPCCAARSSSHRRKV